MSIPRLLYIASSIGSLVSALALTDWYVDKNNANCANGTGTQVAPFCNIGDAIAVAVSGDTIHVAPSTYFENLSFWSNVDVSVIGTAGQASTIVDGSAAGSVAVIPSAATVTIDGLTLRNGSAIGGGGIYTYGTLTLLNSTVSGNVATGYDGGGGIRVGYGAGATTLVNSTVSNNTTTYLFGGDGAGISAHYGASLNLTNCTVSGNTISAGFGGYGAGIFTYKTPLFINKTTISGNSTTYLGGGIMAYKSNPTEIRNSTISGNTGTGLLTYGHQPYPTTLLNCTITNNSSNFRAAGFSHDMSVPAQVRNTIIAGNIGGGYASDNIGGSFSSLGHNLIGHATGGTGFTNGVSGDKVGTQAVPLDPLLGALANNGGPTETHALLGGSPCIDAGDPVVFEPTDQRGIARIAGQTDIGAFEVGATVAAFCTAGTTTHGCVPSIAGLGTPSASASSGFTITVSSVEGQKQGLIFYGINNSGFTPLPWGPSSSFLCVKQPTQRMGVQNSGGTLNTCGGALATDWNAFRAGNPAALGSPFASGNVVYAQGWFRDPPSPKNTMLSNALQFTLGP
jgi:hypothetical protein